MGKIDAKMEGRTEGLELALRIVKEGGAEALEREMKHRRVTGIKVPVDHREMDKAAQKIKEQILDTVLAMSIMVLRDEFGFGKKRLDQFKVRFNLKTECMNDGLVTWADILEAIRDETGIELTIRENR